MGPSSSASGPTSRRGSARSIRSCRRPEPTRTNPVHSESRRFNQSANQKIKASKRKQTKTKYAFIDLRLFSRNRAFSEGYERKKQKNFPILNSRAGLWRWSHISVQRCLFAWSRCQQHRTYFCFRQEIARLIVFVFCCMRRDIAAEAVMDGLDLVEPVQTRASVTRAIAWPSPIHIAAFPARSSGRPPDIEAPMPGTLPPPSHLEGPLGSRGKSERADR